MSIETFEILWPQELAEPPTDTVALQAESSSPIEYAKDNPVDASLFIVGALVVGVVGKWANSSTAKDKQKQDQ